MTFMQKLPWKLIFAYVLDWVFVIGIAAIGGGLSYRAPYKRNFSLVDLAISYPYRADEIVSVPVLVIITFLAPAGLIAAFVTFVFPPPTSWREIKTRKFWQRKIWEGNAGLLGLALSYALALTITQVVKVSVGKPRPDFLARCQPDLTDIQEYIRGGAGFDISPSWSIVDVDICTQPDAKTLEEGFKAYFSGHSSASFAGLAYLALWLCVKLNVTFPYVQPYTAQDLSAITAKDREVLPTYRRAARDADNDKATALVDRHHVHMYRKAAAAPPVWGILIVLLPLLLAIWIASTRYQEFKHDGFDCICGSVCGIFTAWIGFRIYHNSLLRGQTWTWGPRNWDNAFIVTNTARQRSTLHRRRGDEHGTLSKETSPSEVNGRSADNH